MTLTQVAREIGRPVSSVQRALAGLMRDGVITAYLAAGRPLYRLSDGAPLGALLEVARWSLRLPASTRP